MRRKKNRSRLLPFGAGLAAGYLLTIGVAAAGALVMWLTGADSSMAWLTAVPAAALGSFLCGRTAGKQRRRGGLKTGAVCGVLYCVPLILAALIFGTVQGILLPVKAALCIGFAAAGGGSGVKSEGASEVPACGARAVRRGGYSAVSRGAFRGGERLGRWLP